MLPSHYYVVDIFQIVYEVYSLKLMAQRSLSYRSGVPLRNMNKYSPKLQIQNADYWLTHERNDDLYLRINGDAGRAVFTPRYVPVDNMTVLHKLEEIGFGEDVEVQCHLDQEFMSLAILDQGQEFAVNGNDRVKSGISIGNSEIGLAALSISAFLLRLVCTNGLMLKTEDVRG